MENRKSIYFDCIGAGTMEERLKAAAEAGFADVEIRTIIGAEVLSRLNSETEGVITPGFFLSAVNNVGLNEKFDYYIFEKNCKWPG